MSSFTSDLRVKVLDNGDRYEILDEFVYYRDDNRSIKLKVPVGYVTDFATVPRIFWSIFPPFGKYTKAAVLHDMLCDAFLEKKTWDTVLTVDSEVKAEDRLKFVTRKEADEIFKEAMAAVGVSKFDKFCLYWAVRLYAICKYGRNK